MVRGLSQSFDGGRHQVRDWMTSKPLTIEPAADCEEARRRMLEPGSGTFR